MARRIASEVQAALQIDLGRRAARIPIAERSPADLFWQGMLHFFRGTREGYEQARTLARRVIEAQPESADGLVLLGLTHGYDFWGSDPRTAIAGMRAAGARALESDPQSAGALAILATGKVRSSPARVSPTPDAARSWPP